MSSNIYTALQLDSLALHHTALQLDSLALHHTALQLDSLALHHTALQLDSLALHHTALQLDSLALHHTALQLDSLALHTVETRAILELVFHVFEENELICAEVLLLSWTFVDSSETNIFLRDSSTLF